MQPQRRYASLPQDVRDALVAEQYCYLTTTGRLSGQQHQIEIWFAIKGASLYMLSGDSGAARRRAGWVANISANPSVSVRIGPETFEAEARVVTNETEDALARRLPLTKYAASNDDLADWGREALPVAVDI